MNRHSSTLLFAALVLCAHACGDSPAGRGPGSDTTPPEDASDSRGDAVQHDGAGDVAGDAAHEDAPAADGSGDSADTVDSAADATSDSAADATSDDAADASSDSTADATSDGAADAGGPDAVVCDTFGCACSVHTDCRDGLCVEDLDGSICSEMCLTSCPSDDFACRPVAIGDAPAQDQCVPRHPHLCKPCRDDAECANALDPAATALCLPAADPKVGRFCASSCADAPCPDGYTCGDVALADGGSARQCLPSNGTCECRPAWAALDLVTTCQRDSAFGACDGTRSCGLDGLTACDAREPALEVCNLVDDDCNGATDDILPAACDIAPTFDSPATCPGTLACEGGQEVCSGRAPSAETCNLGDDDCDGATDEDTCDDGLACTDDTCAGSAPPDAACAHPLRLGFCLIDGACVAENTPNPAFACQRCVPALATTGWTGGGADAQCHIDGECWPAGAGKPGEPCLRCRPELSGTSWSSAADEDLIACDDGDACTQGDVCAGGSCAGTPYSCSDGLACTDDVCAGDGSCRFPLHGGQCLIAGVCYADGARPDSASCRVCDATRPSAWSAPATALACDDGNACTSADVCHASLCAGTAYSCDDQEACTIDSCNGDGQCTHAIAESFCFIGGECWQNGASDPNDPCHMCVSPAPHGWTSISQCKVCTLDAECDEVFPPAPDQCMVPACVNGMCGQVARDCSDADACTIDGCDPRAGCYHRRALETDGALGYLMCPGALTQADALSVCQAEGMALASFDTTKEADAFDALAASYELALPWVATASGVTCSTPRFRIAPPLCRVWESATDPACSQDAACSELHPFVCQLDCDDADPCTADSVDSDTGACVHKAQACDCTPECVPGQCGMVDGCGRLCGCASDEYCDGGSSQCLSVHFQGNSCLKPDTFAQAQLPLSAHGDISPASPFTSVYSSALCGAPEARDGRYARDQVWSFVAPAVGDYQVTVTPDNAYGDLQVYAAPFDQCDTTCSAYADDNIEGVSETLILTATIPNQSFNLIVDGATPLTEDSYTISVSAFVPPSELAGNMCQKARTLTADVPASGDIRPSSGLTADYSAVSCAGAAPDGAASIDEVWVFTAPTADAYLVTVTPTTADTDFILYQFPSVACDTSCVQYANLHGVGADETTVAQPTSAGQVFYIIVDATAAGTVGAYTIEAYAL